MSGFFNALSAHPRWFEAHGEIIVVLSPEAQNFDEGFLMKGEAALMLIVGWWYPFTPSWVEKRE